MIRACVMSLLLAAPVAAQTSETLVRPQGITALGQKPDYDPALLDSCLDTARGYGEKHDCIGVGAEACAATEAGASTIGLGYCFTSEWEHWDARLNTAYQALLVQQAQVDEDNAAFNPNIPSGLDLLRDMQRGWIPFRDTACSWEAVQWGGGTGAGPASAACLMGLTAQQALFLEERVF